MRNIPAETRTRHYSQIEAICQQVNKPDFRATVYNVYNSLAFVPKYVYAPIGDKMGIIFEGENEVVSIEEK